MLKFIFLIILIVSSSSALDFTIIDITGQKSFDYFASLQLWLLLIISPMLLTFSLLKYVKKIL